MPEKSSSLNSKRLNSKALNSLAQKRLAFFLSMAEKSPSLKKMGPKRRPWESAVRLVDAREMKRLNSSFRGKAYATDVLSFPIPPHFFELKGWVHLGELVICEPVLKAQAKEQGHSVAQELDVLIVHGLLHLLGMDHERSEKEAKLMQSWEVKMLKKKANLIQGTLKSLSKGLIERTQSVKHR